MAFFNKDSLSGLISRKIDKALMNYRMIQEGETLAVAVSGGKDSLCLVYFLHLKQNAFAVPFKIRAVHITMDFSPGETRTEPVIREALDKWEIPLETREVPVLGRLKPGRKMNCYWCATQRRVELMRFAEETGCSKIALGHHMDDILETFIMNMAFKGELSTMLPVLKYDHYPCTIIRPLAFVKEEEIIRFAEEHDLRAASRSCIYDSRSRRKPAREALEVLAGEMPGVRENILKAMGNRNERYLL